MTKTTKRPREISILTINVDDPLSCHATDHVTRYTQVLAGVSASYTDDAQQS